MTKIWVDGSADQEGRAGVGVNIQISEHIGDHTSNQAELIAIQRALELTTGDVTIYSDSEYAIGVLSKGWKIKVNIEIISKIKKLMKRRKITLKKIPRGQNTVADRLAKEGKNG